MKRSARSWNVVSVGTSTIPRAAIDSSSSGSRCSDSPCSTVSTPSRGEPRAVKALGVGGYADPQPVGLVDDRVQLLGGHLRRLGILDQHRARAGRHQLDEVGAAAQLLAHRLAHVLGAVGLAVHRGEDAPPGAVAEMIRPHERIRGPSTIPSRTASRSTIASSS